MRIVIAGMIILASTFANAQPQPAKPKCPTDVTAAGFEVWPPLAIPLGITVQGEHACGRRIECTGAQPGNARRLCRWLPAR